MPHTKKMRLTYLFLTIVFVLCTIWSNTQSVQNYSSLRVSIALDSNHRYVHLKLCNKLDDKFYLSNFYRLGTHFRILKREASGKYIDYRSIFNSIAMQAVLDSVPQPNPFGFFERKNYFADITAKELSEELKKNEYYDPNLVGEPYEEFYSTLMSVWYLNEFECLEDSVDLNPVKTEKGKYKVFFEYSVYPIPLEESLGSYMYRFYQDRMPMELRSYRRWQGRITSDTLELEIK